MERVQPDVILEGDNPPDWQEAGRHLWTQLPDYYVAETYGREHQIRVLGIAQAPRLTCSPGPATAASGDRVRRFGQAAKALRNLGAWEALMAFGEDSSWGFAAAQDRIELERMEPASRAMLTDSATIREQDRTAAAIIDVVQRYPGRRIVVLFGSSQTYPVASRLRRDPHVSLLDVRGFLPTASQVEAARRVADAVLLLGASLDGWSLPNMPQARDHHRTRALLAWLDQHASERTLAAYYHAKWDMLVGKYDDAARLLDQILEAHPDVDLPWLPNSEWSWPPWSGLEMKARFTRATLHDLMGEHAQARALYRELLAEVPAAQLRPRFRGPDRYYDLTVYLEDLAREPYRGGPWEAFRAQESLRCREPDRQPDHTWPR